MTTLSPTDCSDVTRVDVSSETLCFNSSDEKSPLWPPLVMNGMAPPWRSYVWWKVLQLAFIRPLHVRVVLNDRTRTGFTNPVCIDNEKYCSEPDLLMTQCCFNDNWLACVSGVWSDVAPEPVAMATNQLHRSPPLVSHLSWRLSIHLPLSLSSALMFVQSTW